MQFSEITGNVFDYADDYHIVHCISADFALGKGFAKEVDTRYNTKEYLDRWYSGYSRAELCKGACLNVGNVYNLVTKYHYYDKPSYPALEKALILLRDMGTAKNKLVMPRIGCGLDGLRWTTVKSILNKVFKDTDTEILVVTLPKGEMCHGNFNVQ